MKMWRHILTVRYNQTVYHLFWKQIWKQNVKKLPRLKDGIIDTLPASYNVKTATTDVEFVTKYVQNQP